MKNEIGRKLTSLTLMTIMVAGGLTFAVPGVMPSAFAANANLFVSAENSLFSNYMSGPQVIEVVVINPEISDTDEAKGEPDVKVNGKKLRMVQAVDGNWYGYFADRKQAQIADSTTTVAGAGLDFGSFCTATTTSIGGVATFFSESRGIAVNDATEGEQGTNPPVAITDTCGGAIAADGSLNVVREAKDPNTNGAVPIGQIGLALATDWPFIQLYDLSPGGNVIVSYNKGGGVQSTTLTFDTVDQFADIKLDRTKYPQNAQVHVTVTDLWLNIDPTDEDSWTFGTNATNGTTTNYQVFNENGDDEGAAVAGGVINIDTPGTLGSLMCEDNCILILNTNANTALSDIVTIQDNDDTNVTGCGLFTASSCTINSAASPALQENTQPVTLTELGPNSGIFGTYDESDTSVIQVTSNATRGKSATIDYNETPITILIGFSYATLDIQPVDEEWNSGQEIPVVLVDEDANKNSRSDEDLDVNNPDVQIIPTLQTGTPFTLADFADSPITAVFLNVTLPDTITPFTNAGTGGNFSSQTNTEPSQQGEDGIKQGADDSGKRVTVTPNFDGSANVVGINSALMSDLLGTIHDTQVATADDDRLHGTNLLNYDVRALGITSVDIFLVNNTVGPINPLNGTFFGNSTFIQLVDDGAAQGLVSLNNTIGSGVGDPSDIFAIDPDDSIGIAIADASGGPFTVATTSPLPLVVDFFSFGFFDDGVSASERVANQIIRLELEESGDNTSTFEGSLEFIMINQLNVLDEDTYLGLSPIADDPSFIAFEDLTDEDSPRVTYADLAQDGTILPVADQEEAPSHSGVVSFDFASYKIADTVTVTLQDQDLNVDSDLIDIFTVVPATDSDIPDTVGEAGLPNFPFGDLGRLLDITFDDQLWTSSTANSSPACITTLAGVVGTDTGLAGTGFTLVETGIATGIFTGDFAVPSAWCPSGATETLSTTGLDLEVNYVDFRDASGEIIEVGDGAGIRANTGSISLDRTVYPVPFGVPDNFPGVSTSETTPDGRSVFPIHQTGMGGATAGLDTGEFLGHGDVQLHIRVNDPDFDISPGGEDFIARDKAGSTVGPVKITVLRGANSVIIGYAGGDAAQAGLIGVGTTSTTDRDFGPIKEIAPDAGIFEVDVALRYTDGPASDTCPTTPATGFTSLVGTGGGESTRFDDVSAPTGEAGTFCILQGDIIQVEYTDPEDASGDVNTVTDSATFDLRNGVLQSDKSVYIIGSDMIMTLIEPDFDLDNDAAETFDLDLIEWDSDAATITMGSSLNFDPEPTDFRETGDSTGIFQIVIEIPEFPVVGGTDRLERGEEIVLEYTDWGPSGSDFVGDEDEDVNLTIFTSNFGATVELDQKVYTWTDKVYITIVAPDHNFDSNLVDEIGDSDIDPIKVATRGHKLSNYKLVETGTDTGIFTGEVILTGFQHDADGDVQTGAATTGSDTNQRTEGSGPTNGFLEADDDDGLTVSFEFSEDETVVGSALIRWNIGEVQWLEASYPASGTGVIRVVDPDMNLNPEAVDNFNVDVWSDSDAGGIDLTVTETNEATGIFEGTVFFTVTDESSGHRLRVSEGDTITAEYEDNTLPDPYTTADELDITGTSLIGTIVPPLERAPASNARVVDAFGNSLASVSVDQQVQITADLANGQDREQSFAYLVQVQDGNGVTVALAWISGSLSAGQSFSPALSWTPDAPGTYTATVFVWESVDNPTALSPPVSVNISVS